jgi:hypothetical protein
MDPPGAMRTPSHASDQSPSAQRLWLRWGTVVLAADLVIHNGTGLLVNDWEGWGVAAGTFVFVLVTGLVIVGLTFGLLVRWGLKPSPPGGRNRAALAALLTGIASLAAYAIFFTWAPVLIAPAALLLARQGLRTADKRAERAIALTGGALGLVSLAFFVFLLVVVVATGDYPFGL